MRMSKNKIEILTGPQGGFYFYRPDGTKQYVRPCKYCGTMIWWKYAYGLVPAGEKNVKYEVDGTVHEYERCQAIQEQKKSAASAQNASSINHSSPRSATSPDTLNAPPQDVPSARITPGSVSMLEKSVKQLVIDVNNLKTLLTDVANGMAVLQTKSAQQDAALILQRVKDIGDFVMQTQQHYEKYFTRLENMCLSLEAEMDEIKRLLKSGGEKQKSKKEK